MRAHARADHASACAPSCGACRSCLRACASVHTGGLHVSLSVSSSMSPSAELRRFRTQLSGVGIVFRLHEQTGKLLVHSLNDGGSAMASGKIKEGDVLLQVSRVDVTNCPRPVATFLISMYAIEHQN